MLIRSHHARDLPPPSPARRAQSTFCHQIQEHCASLGRSMHVINLDPAADNFAYSVSLDIRELVDVEARATLPCAAASLGAQRSRTARVRLPAGRA